MNNVLRKELLKNALYIGIILLIAAVSTYYIYNKFQTNRDVDFNSKSLDIIYHDSGNEISINKVTPMTDSVGLSTNAYDLTIKNNLTIGVDYIIKIVDDTDKINETNANIIPKENIRISIKTIDMPNKIYTLSELEDGVLLEKEIEALKKDDITIRVWVGKDSEISSGTNMKYYGKIQVIENDK